MTEQPLIGQEEIERLLSQAKDSASSAADRRGPCGRRRGRKQRSVPAAAGPPRNPVAGGGPGDRRGDPVAAQRPRPLPQGRQRIPCPATTASPPATSEFLFNQAEQALESINAASSDDLPQGVVSYRLEEFTGSRRLEENATLDLIRDVELDLKIELGRTHMYLEDVLKLRKGSVVPLDKLAGDPVDIYVNGRLIARGEVLVLNDNFCVRVAELIAGAQRRRSWTLRN